MLFIVNNLSTCVFYNKLTMNNEKFPIYGSFLVCGEAKQHFLEGGGVYHSLLTCTLPRCNPVVPSFPLPETVSMTMHLYYLTIGHRLHRKCGKCVHVHKHRYHHVTNKLTGVTSLMSSTS